MVKIKLTPTGKKNDRRYRIVVAPARSKLTGKYLDLLGTYNPHDDKNKININLKKYKQWISFGAKPTQTINNLIIKNL